MGTPEVGGPRFSRRQVLRILGLSQRQLSAWERLGFLPPRAAPPSEATPNAPGEDQPSSRKKSRTRFPENRDYTFTDLLTLRTLIRLRKSGIPAARIRQAHVALRQKLTQVKSPWSELEVQANRRSLSVLFEGVRMEPLTGQLLLEYEARTPGGNLRSLERPGPRSKESDADRRERAHRLFLAGLRYEERPGTLSKAIRAYQIAIELDPQAVEPHINLGTLHYNLGQLDEAEKCYRAAMSLAPRYALAHFNLANVFDERNELLQARHHYEEAVRLNPSYPDPHYNLALVYEKLGLHGRARQQWLAYLKLDLDSPWAEVARQQLEKTRLPVVPPPQPFEKNA